MIDFYSDGSTVGVALSGWTSVILLVFIIFVILNFISTKVTLTKKIIIFYQVKKRVKKAVPYWWNFTNILYSILLTHRENGKYVIPVGLKYKMNSSKSFEVKTFLYTTSLGKIENEISYDYLLSMISKIDTDNNINYTQMSRDKKLKDLGIN